MKALNWILCLAMVITTILTLIIVITSQQEINELKQNNSNLKVKNKVLKTVIKRYMAEYSWDVEVSAYTARPQE